METGWRCVIFHGDKLSLDKFLIVHLRKEFAGAMKLA